MLAVVPRPRRVNIHVLPLHSLRSLGIIFFLLVLAQLLHVIFGFYAYFVSKYYILVAIQHLASVPLSSYYSLLKTLPQESVLNYILDIVHFSGWNAEGR